MKIKPLILLVTLVLSSFVLVGITLSDFPPEPTGTYSPWGDLNDDGVIDIFDIVWLSGRYKETGTPVNKTALLYNVSDTLGALNAQVDELQSYIDILQIRVEVLENQSKWMVAPSFDSGWISINPGDRYYFFHNQNTTNVLVYVIGKNASGFIHQWRIGMDYDSNFGSSADYGLFWSRLDTNAISVVRGPSDWEWDEVRVMIWKILEP